MSRDLLRRALDALEECRLADYGDLTLTDDICAELEKPEPLDIGITTEFEGIEGRFRLQGVRIRDE